MTIKTRVPVKLNVLPDDYNEVESIAELLKFLVKHLVVEVPSDITNVVVGTKQPDDANRQSVWLRQNGAGTVIGIYLYTGGRWSQFFPPPQQVIWMYGDSRVIPSGYRLIDATHPDFTAFTRGHIIARYQRDPDDEYYTYFAVTFTGF